MAAHIYLVMVTVDGREHVVVCATRDEETAEELARRAGGHVDTVLLIDPDVE